MIRVVMDSFESLPTIENLLYGITVEVYFFVTGTVDQFY